MSNSNTCKCAPNSTGPTKATASSFAFQMCDGGELVNVSANDVANFLINTIYGDSVGNPPSAGEYLVKFDGNGVRSIIPYTPTESRSEYILKEYETFIPAGVGSSQDFVSWNFANPSFFAFDTQPPQDSNPSHALIKFRSYTDNDSKHLDIRDKFDNPVYYIRGEEEDDDSVNTDGAWVPLDIVNGEYGVYLSASSNNTLLNASLIGYANVFILNSDGTTAGGIVSGGGSTPSDPVSPIPLTITHLSHTYNDAGNDVTVVEWVLNKDLTSSDQYTLYFDLGEIIEEHTLNHVDGLTSDKQRLTVTWDSQHSHSLHSLKIDVLVKDVTNNTFGPTATSNTGASSGNIPVSFQSTTTIV